MPDDTPVAAPQAVPDTQPASEHSQILADLETPAAPVATPEGEAQEETVDPSILNSREDILKQYNKLAEQKRELKAREEELERRQSAVAPAPQPQPQPSQPQAAHAASPSTAFLEEFEPASDGERILLEFAKGVQARLDDFERKAGFVENLEQQITQAEHERITNGFLERATEAANHLKSLGLTEITEADIITAVGPYAQAIIGPRGEFPDYRKFVGLWMAENPDVADVLRKTPDPQPVAPTLPGNGGVRTGSAPRAERERIMADLLSSH